jgi:hypothetical protein
VEEDFRIKSSVLADLGPLPDVVESNTETAWHTFLQLEEQHSATLSTARPSQFAALRRVRQFSPLGGVTVDDVMAEARRFNRVCPAQSDWLRLQAVLAEHGGPDAPGAMYGAAFRTMSALARRMAVRDQVEWAAEHGCLQEVYAFLHALPEDRWTHMGD